MSVDVINAVFEFGSSVLLLLNLRKLITDKKVAGVSIVPTAWFSLWGAWNLIYYARLEQTWSWFAGIAVFIANTAWVVLALYYTYKDRK